MKSAPKITLHTKHDSEGDPDDFTPLEKRERARELTIEVARNKTQRTEVILSEMDRANPGVVYLGINLYTGQRHADTSIASDVTVRQLDELIDTLTLARDMAIVEGMIEPAV